MTRELSISELAALAAETDDQTETSVAGDFERELIPEGPNFLRFVEYIETGKHPRKAYQGKEKPPAESVRLTFECVHPKKSIIEYEVDGVKKKRGQLITVRVSKSLSDKATFKKLFNAMTYGRDSIKHFAQMLGEPFCGTIYHNKSKGTDGKEVVYANLNNSDGVYSISAPKHYDPLTDVTTDLTNHIPAPFAPVRIFLWNNPTKATWDSLFIDGTRTVKDGDKETEVSKNWLQEQIMSALNYEGSPLHQMLHGVSDLPVTEAAKPEAKQETGTIELDEKPATAKAAEKAVEAAKSQPATKPAETSANDALAALGLVG